MAQKINRLNARAVATITKPGREIHAPYRLKYFRRVLEFIHNENHFRVWGSAQVGEFCCAVPKA
jgi:hypothetical protein